MRTLHKTSLIFVLFVLLPGRAPATQGVAPLAAEKIKRVESIVSAEMARMWTHYVLSGGEKSAGGLGWPVTEHNGQREVWHSGGQQRVSTFLYLLPESGLAVVIMANLEDADVGLVARKVSDALLQE